MKFETLRNRMVSVAGVMLVLALGTGSAYAGKGDAPGKPDKPPKNKYTAPQLSVDIYNWCSIEDGILTIDSEIAETSDDDSFGVVEADSRIVTVTAYKSSKRDVLGQTVDNSGDPIDLCDAVMGIENIEDATSLNALITLNFTVDDVFKSYTSRCDDDPSNNVYDPETGELVYNEELDESDLSKYLPISCPTD